MLRWTVLLIAGLLAATPGWALVKDTTVKPIVKPNRAVRKPTVVAPAPVVPLTDEQVALAQQVYVGTIPCELAVVVHVAPDARQNGRFILEIGSHRHLMVPVPTTTGAVRLEDGATGAVWLQLGNKSMLMNQKLGRRLADECHNPQQLLVAQALERQGSASLLDDSAQAVAPATPVQSAQSQNPVETSK